MKTTPVSIGIVGAGQMALNNHLPVLMALPEVSVCWVADVDLVKAKIGARLARVRALSTADLSELPPVDVAVLAIPYGARPPFLELFAERGTAVYVEKPIAADAAEHQSIASQFPEHSLSCGFQLRSSGGVQCLRSLVATGIFGKLQSIRVEFGGPGTRGGSYQSDIHLAGGGMLFDVAIHFIDAALYVAGTNCVRVEHSRMVREKGFDLETEATAVLTDGNGQRTRLEILVSALRFTTMECSFRFDHAHVVHRPFGDDSLRVESADGRAIRFLGDWHVKPDAPAACLGAHWVNVIKALRECTPNYTSACSALSTSELVGQLYEATQ